MTSLSLAKAQALSLHLAPLSPNAISKSQTPEFLDCGRWDQLFYQKVQGGCSSSKVGMLVTLTGMEMMAHGSPCCSRERRIM